MAIYLSNDGEIDTTPIIETAWQADKSVTLPIIHPFSKHHLLFLLYGPQTPLINNRFGIPEPMAEVPAICSLEELDIIYTPLVAFDKQGSRIGMGGGFYDRTLAHLRNTSAACKIIGLAHDCQQVEHIQPQPWDMPLDEIITPSHHIIAD